MHRFHFCLALILVVSAARGLAADGMLPVSLIKVPESVSSIFIAEAGSAQFHRFEQSAGKIVHAGSVYMSIGRAGVGKRHSGDRRTPIGVYFVTEQLDTSRLHEKYGVTAFPLDYPNAWDERMDRDGDGIWVHGVDPAGGKRPTKDTEGCIALPNDDLLALVPEFQDNVTPVVVTQKVTWGSADQNEALRGELEASVALWASSQANGDLYAYLSSYDNGFERWGLNRDEWLSLSMRIANEQAAETVAVNDLLLIAYPEEPGLYLSRFRLDRVRDSATVEVMKRLYWRRDEHGALKIIAENDG